MSNEQCVCNKYGDAIDLSAHAEQLHARIAELEERIELKSIAQAEAFSQRNARIAELEEQERNSRATSGEMIVLHAKQHSRIAELEAAVRGFRYAYNRRTVDEVGYHNAIGRLLTLGTDNPSSGE